MSHPHTNLDEALADILVDVGTRATTLDTGGASTLPALERFGNAGLADIGSPGGPGTVEQMARVLRDVAGACMSTAFSLWAHRMVVEYVARSRAIDAHAWLEDLARGRRPGITGMAAAFRELSGCGQVDIDATPTADGWTLNGRIAWSSNLYDHALLITAARTGDGCLIVVGLPVNAPGVSVTRFPGLLALDSTESSAVTLENVHVHGRQVLTFEVESFLRDVRPVFLLLQSSLGLGLATRALDEIGELSDGTARVFADQVNSTKSRLRQAVNRQVELLQRHDERNLVTPAELLPLRLESADIATQASALELRLAGGRGFVRASDTSRRYREAAFLPVQSPSEAQLRWELDRAMPVPA